MKAFQLLMALHRIKYFNWSVCMSVRLSVTSNIVHVLINFWIFTLSLKSYKIIAYVLSPLYTIW